MRKGVRCSDVVTGRGARLEEGVEGGGGRERAESLKLLQHRDRQPRRHCPAHARSPRRTPGARAVTAQDARPRDRGEELAFANEDGARVCKRRRGSSSLEQLQRCEIAKGGGSAAQPSLLMIPCTKPRHVDGSTCAPNCARRGSAVERFDRLRSFSFLCASKRSYAQREPTLCEGVRKVFGRRVRGAPLAWLRALSAPAEARARSCCSSCFSSPARPCPCPWPSPSARSFAPLRASAAKACAQRGRQAGAQLARGPPLPLPPVLTGHVSSLLPY